MFVNSNRATCSSQLAIVYSVYTCAFPENVRCPLVLLACSNVLHAYKCVLLAVVTEYTSDSIIRWPLVLFAMYYMLMCNLLL